MTIVTYQNYQQPIRQTSQFKFLVLIKTVFIVAFLLININSSIAQWNTVNVGTAENLFSVNYFSSNDIWIGSNNRFVRTSNNGNTWIVAYLVDQSQTLIIGAVNDIELISPASANATGIYYAGNNEVIINTQDSGSTWSLVHNNNTVPLLRYLESIDRSGSVCIAVGNSGRIARSNNSGLNWSMVSSGTNKLLNDVKFISPTSLIAIGDKIIIRSNDTGLTWTPVTFPRILFSLSVKANCLYAGIKSSITLYKSIDSGATFTPITLPFLSNGVVHAISTDTVMVAGTDGLYASFNGGSAWEKYDLSGYREIHMIDFINSSSGIAVGDSGYVVRTNNLGNTPSFPIVSFSYNNLPHYCLNDTIALTNATANLPGYTYSWKYDSVAFSTQYSTSKVLTSAGTHTISLTVTNSYGSSTFTQQITVTGHAIQPFTLQGLPATVCSGNTAALNIPNS